MVRPGIVSLFDQLSVNFVVGLLLMIYNYDSSANYYWYVDDSYDGTTTTICATEIYISVANEAVFIDTKLSTYVSAQ